MSNLGNKPQEIYSDLEPQKGSIVWGQKTLEVHNIMYQELGKKIMSSLKQDLSNFPLEFQSPDIENFRENVSKYLELKLAPFTPQKHHDFFRLKDCLLLTKVRFTGVKVDSDPQNGITEDNKLVVHLKCPWQITENSQCIDLSNVQKRLVKEQGLSEKDAALTIFQLLKEDNEFLMLDESE